jgi:hypothetical protein
MPIMSGSSGNGDQMTLAGLVSNEDAFTLRALSTQGSGWECSLYLPDLSAVQGLVADGTHALSASRPLSVSGRSPPMFDQAS